MSTTILAIMAILFIVLAKNSQRDLASTDNKDFAELYQR
jgi:hypothetical protein